MKKVAVINMIIFLAAVSSFAVNAGPEGYVKTKNSQFNCSKIDVGPSKARLVLDNGEKITLLTNEVIAYKKDGKIFEKVDLYKNNKSANRQVFMEFIKYKNGLKLYKYTTYEEGGDLATGVYYPLQKVERFYIYRDGNYHLQIDEKNYKNVFQFFDLKVKMVE